MILELRILIYCFVGSLGVITDFSITWILREKLKLNQYVASTVGFAIAVTQNYWLNKIWTFRDRVDASVFKQWCLFLGVSLIGLLINVFVLKKLNTLFSNQFYWNKLFAIGIVFLWNYFINNILTFAK